MTKENDTKELNIAYVNYHSPWIQSEKEKCYWRSEIERLCNKLYGSD